jgi:hypothetical protein
MLIIEVETASPAPVVIGIASAFAAIRNGKSAANTNLKMGTQENISGARSSPSFEQRRRRQGVGCRENGRLGRGDGGRGGQTANAGSQHESYTDSSHTGRCETSPGRPLMSDAAMHVVFDSAQFTIQILVSELRQQAVQSVVHIPRLTPYN